MAFSAREISSKRISGLVHIYLRETGEVRLGNPFPELLDETTYQQIMTDPNFWIEESLEAKIINHISQYVDIAGSLFHLGTETLITHVYDLLPLNNSRIDLSDVLSRLPILVNRLTRTVFLHIEPIAEKSVRMIFHYFPGYRERWYDVLFFKGMLKGLTVLFELETAEIQLVSTKLFGLHVLHKDLGPNIQFGSSVNQFSYSWNDNPAHLSRSELNKDDISNRHRVIVVSKSDSTSEEYSVVDLSDVVDKSRQLAIENRDLEAAVQVLNYFKSELEKKQKSIAKDLKLAKNIQQGLIPAFIPDWKGIQFWSYYQPMQEVSGDYYDYFPFGSEQLGVVLCDVSGHGVPAAFITALSKMLFTTHRKSKPSEAFKFINRELLELVKQQCYTTCIYAIVQEDYKVIYCVAGHPRPIHYSAKTQMVTTLDGEGTFLGMFPDAGDTYVDKQVQLEPGDKLIFYTDGIVEAENDKGEPFGEERLLQTIANAKHLTIQETIEKIMQVHREFTVGTDPMDDITILGWQLSPELPEFNRLRKEGEALYIQKKYALAKESLSKAHSILPRELGTQLRYGRALALDGEFEKAIATLESYNKFKTNHYLSHSVLGFCYFKVGNIERAESEWKKAHHLNDDNLSILYNLGIVYQKLGLRAKLKEILEKMKRIQSSHETILPLEKKWEKMLDEKT